MTFEVDGVAYLTVTGSVPSGSMSIRISPSYVILITVDYGIYYSAQPNWYGVFTYPGVTTTQVTTAGYSVCIFIPTINNHLFDLRRGRPIRMPYKRGHSGTLQW